MLIHAQSVSHDQVVATPWTAARQAPQSMGFSRQERWIFLTQGSHPHGLHWQVGSLPLSHLGKGEWACKNSTWILADQVHTWSIQAVIKTSGFVHLQNQVGGAL